MDNSRRTRAVVAIDFGTSRSGYAFTFNDPDHIKLNCFDYQNNEEKTHTALAIHGDQGKYEFMAFGDEAHDKLNVPEVLQDKEVHGFRYFKMNLFEEQSTLESITQSKARIPIVNIFACGIGYIAGCALKHMNSVSTERIEFLREDIQWVITVPAIWNNAAKQVMRHAAQQAGLPSNLILALEPEAAALCCRYNRRDLKYNPGTKYILVDCGGGTVDIVFHEIDQEGNTLELRAPTGGPWGSTTIDKNFQQLMTEIFGLEQLQDDRISYAGALAAFEQEKIKFTPKQQRLVRIPMDQLEPVFLDAFNRRHFPSVILEGRRLVIPNEIMVSLFEGPISQIVSCVEEAIQSVPGTFDYIFMVGGFSRNIILRERMERFQNDYTKLVIPEKSHMAVVEGAVHFGLNPGIIQSRFSAYSYGIRAVRHFQSGDPVENKIFVKGRAFCSNIFRCFVKINERVKQDFEVVEFFAPAFDGQTDASVPIYATKDPQLIYINEGMHEIGNLLIQIPKNEKATNRNIKVTMFFGGTEIKVKAEHVIAKKPISCSIDFSFISGIPHV